MKNFKKVLALVLVVATLLSFATVAGAATSASYTDAEDINRTAAVDVLSYIGVLDGYSDKTFRPQGEITRAEAAKIIAMFDNGDATINGLYASANPFTDCVGHWAESSIAYCYKMGIIDGVGNLKFDPESNVTGVQFLKMALIVLGFDAQKEGLTGASWAVNTLALAKKVGLLTGLGNSYDYSANLVREDAAQIMLNALTATTVEYGYALKPATATGLNYVTVAGAVSTGTELYKNWALGKNSWSDCFMRPGYKWTYTENNTTSVIATYKYTPVAKKQTKITACDVLVAAGIAKTDMNSEINLEIYTDGVITKINGKDSVTLCHDWAHQCNTDLAWGGQGVQAELYLLGYATDGTPNYRLVLINTWLGQVATVASTTVDKDGHISSAYQMKLNIWYDGAAAGVEDVTLTASRNVDNTVENYDGQAWTSSATGFAKGDMVLVTKSWKTNCGVVEVNHAESVDGALTGFTDASKAGDPTKTEVDAVEKFDAVNFNLGYNSSKNLDNTQQGYPYVSGAYTFYFDLFGNVIGMTGRKAAAKQYVVIDDIWSHEHRDWTVTADLVNLDASFTKDADVASIVAHDKDYTEEIAALAANNPNFYNRLYTYAVDADGSYYLTRADVQNSADVVIVSGNPNIYVGENSVVTTNEYTQYLFHVGTDKYVAYTGYKNVPDATATHVEWVDDNEDGYADIVYGYGMTFPGTSDICFTFEETIRYAKTINGVRYDVWTVYIDGEETTVYTEANGVTDSKFDGFGLYKLDYATVDGVVVATVTKLTGARVADKKITSCVDTVLKFGDDALTGYNVENVPVYLVDTYHGDVEVGTTADLDDYAGCDVLVEYNVYGAIVALYVQYVG